MNSSIECYSLRGISFRHPNEFAKDHNAGFAEAAVLFVQEQSPFVKKVARLAKYWNTTVFFKEHLSCMFELIGIAAGRDEEKANSDNPSLLNAFKGFLKRVCNSI